MEGRLDIEAVRGQFPILGRSVKGRALVYLDNAATTQKPQSVIDAITGYYAGYNANIHRGIHTLAEEATAGRKQTLIVEGGPGTGKSVYRAVPSTLPMSRSARWTRRTTA
jgi:hypothetical protein